MRRAVVGLRRPHDRLRRAWHDRLRRSWPWLLLAAGLGLATMPAWRALAFGVRVSAEDLLQIRCLPW